MFKKLLSMLALVIAILSVSLLANAASRNEYDFDEPPLVYRVVNCNEWISLRYAPSVYSARLTEIFML